MQMRTIEQTISDKKIKENIRIYIWIDLFAYMYMHICPTLIASLEHVSQSYHVALSSHAGSGSKDVWNFVISSGAPEVRMVGPSLSVKVYTVGWPIPWHLHASPIRNCWHLFHEDLPRLPERWTKNDRCKQLCAWWGHNVVWNAWENWPSIKSWGAIFCCNIPVFLSNIKRLNIFLYILDVAWGVCV